MLWDLGRVRGQFELSETTAFFTWDKYSGFRGEKIRSLDLHNYVVIYFCKWEFNNLMFWRWFRVLKNWHHKFWTFGKVGPFPEPPILKNTFQVPYHLPIKFLRNVCNFWRDVFPNIIVLGVEAEGFGVCLEMIIISHEQVSKNAM